MARLNSAWWRALQPRPVEPTAPGRARRLPLDVSTRLRASSASRRHVKVSLATISPPTRDEDIDDTPMPVAVGPHFSGIDG